MHEISNCINNTSFTEQVLSIVKQIPAGQTSSYREIAIAAGKPRAARAVARIMANNFNPAIPCHRVIRSDGKLGGYNRGGEARKLTLLLAEGYKP